jgi:histidinol-phosphate aminotransferase
VPRFRPDIENIPTYVPGKPIDEVSRELGIADIVKLASNEFPLPPFPEVQHAIAEAAAQVNRYPEDSAYYLTNALAEVLNVRSDHVWMGAGSTQLLRSIGAAVGGRGTSAVYAWPSFIGYRIATAMAAAEAIEVPTDDAGRHDLDAMRRAMRDDTTLVYVCNPNNPTGTTVPDADLNRFIASVPDDVLVVVDEAYHEFATAPDYASQLPSALDRTNVIVARTFSKVYGLAGLRVGYVVARPSLIASLRRTQLPFVVNNLAQVGALAALGHPDRLAERVKENAEGRIRIEAILADRSLPYYPSQANFVAFTPPMAPSEFADAMLHEGVIVRPLGSLIRVTVGLPEENERFAAALDHVIATGAEGVPV